MGVKSLFRKLLPKKPADNSKTRPPFWFKASGAAKGNGPCADYFGVSAAQRGIMPFENDPDGHTRIFGTRRQKFLLKLRAFRESLMKRFVDWRKAFK